MKMTGRIKDIVCWVLFMFVAMPAHAQSDERALAAAVDTIVRVYTQTNIVDRIVEDAYEKHKTAYLATRIAKSYYNYNEEADKYKDQFHKIRQFHRNDTAMAFKYINRAIAIDPKYGEAYVTACDILDYADNTEEGMKWLQRGEKLNPNDSSLCLASATILARTDLNAAIAKLEEFQKINPSFPVNLYIARIYDKIDVKGNAYRAQVAEYYSKIDKSRMTQGDIETYVMSLFYSGQNEECNIQAEDGLKYFPRSLALNRFYFRSLIPLKKYAEAMTAFDNLKASENSILEVRDSINYAAALAGTKKYDAAMKLYDEILAKPHLSDNDRDATNIYVNQCMQSRVKGYTDMGDYQQAVDFYSDFLEKRRAEGKVDDMMNYTLANIYIDWAAEQNGQEKVATLMKADRILENAIANAQRKSNAITFSAVRIFSIYFKIDPSAESGVGVPAINQFEQLLTADGNVPTGSNATRLVTAYRYMMGYYAYAKSDYKTAMVYADKILDLDPLNDSALKFSEAMSKAGRRR